MLRNAIAVLLSLAAATAFANPCPTQFEVDGVTPKPVVPVPGGVYLGTINWTNNNVYLLQGQVFIGNGRSDSTGTLNIQAGTIIKGLPGQQDSCKVVIITRHSKIFASGTPTCPIVFTSSSDNVDDSTDLGPADRALWGSLVICGAAPINTPGDTNFIEGLSANYKTVYGGYDCHDNSGVVQYVSLRHGGSLLAPNNEINGLTMCGIGDGTTIDHIEAFANEDDGFEWFGGNVNCQYLVNAFCDDDGFDWDQGFSGKLQFLFVVNDSISNGDHIFEMDSDDATFVGRPPFSKPTVYNWTAIGRGYNSPSVGGKQDNALKFKEDSGGHLRNGINLEIARFAYDLEDKDGVQGAFGDCVTGPTNDAEKRARCATSGSPNDTCQGNPLYSVADIDVYSVDWWRVGTTNTATDMAPAAKPWVGARMGDWVTAVQAINGGQVWPNDVIQDPGITYGANFRQPFNHTLDPRPSAVGIAYTMNHPNPNSENSFFNNVPYIGAFSADSNWAIGWTALWYYGYFPAPAPICTHCGDADGNTFVNISDAVLIINFIFVGPPTYTIGDCSYLQGRGDADASGFVNISDAVSLINFVFLGTPQYCPHCLGGPNWTGGVCGQ